LKPVTYQSSEFGFSRKNISRAALDVVDGLHRAGYDSYLVGGCVRDLLLGKSPKDYDVTTDATPEQVRELFDRARIIGRRFRIVHVRFRREVIEVATYRADPNRAKKKGWFSWSKKPKNSDGRILDDNVYGDIDDDAVRRDFTVNALYYVPSNEQVLDFLGGVNDVRQGRLKMIGKPAERFAEDPVRMLRVIRFKAKLDLQPEDNLNNAIKKNCALLGQVPAARLFDEVLKLFHHAHGVRSWQELCQSGLAPYLFSQTMEVLQHEDGERWQQLIISALENTDRRISKGKPVIPAFLYAVLLWRPYCLRYETVLGGRANHQEAMQQAGDQVFAAQTLQVAIPRRVSAPAIEVWQMQNGLERRRPRSIMPIISNRRFRAAYDFLILRSKIGEVEPSLVEWWTRIQDVDEAGQRQMIGELNNTGPGKPRRKRSPRKRKSRSGSETGHDVKDK